MATYVNDLRLKEIATGDESGTWGDTTNTNLELIAEAFSYGTEAITTNADTHTTTIADGATDPGRSMYLKYTGTLDSACTITIGPNTVSKMWFIENATSGSQNIIISQGSGANITIPPGDVKVVYTDGAGSGAAVVDAFASLSVVDLKVQDDLTVTDDLIVNGDIDLEGNMDVNGSLETDALSLNGTTVTSTAAEINLLDGSSANTVVNSKAVIYGSSGEVAGTLSTAAQPNITSLGTLTALTGGTGDLNWDSGTLFVDSSANSVGIGTTSPSGKLEVKGSGTSPIVYFGNGVDNAPNRQLAFSGGSSGLVWDLDATGASSVGGQLTLSTNGTERMRINSSGNVGIGTTSLSYKLTVQEAIDTYAFNIRDTIGNERVLIGSRATAPIDNIIPVQIANDNTGNLLLSSRTNNASGIKFYSSTGTTAIERMRIDSSGNVGIGATPPSGVRTKIKGLAEATNLATSATSAALFIEPYSGSSWGLGIGSISGQKQYIQGVSAAGDSSRELLINPYGGNVGIGTVSPNSLLDIEADPPVFTLTNSRDGSWTSGDLIGHIKFFSNDSSGIGSHEVGFIKAVADTGSTALGSALTFGVAPYNTAASEAMRIDEDGNVGIGTSSPSQKLSVLGTASVPPARFTANGNTNSLEVFGFSTTDASNGILCNAGTSANDYSARFRKHDGTVIMEVSGTGNVGIGTTSPASTISGSAALLHLYDGTNNNLASLALQAGTVGSKWEIGALNTNALGFFDDGAERMRIDSSGNVGIGCTPDAWSGYSVLQIGTAGSLSASEDTTFVGANAYSSASGWKYVTTDEASLYQQESAQHVWYTAASGSADAAITWSERMRMDSSGNVGIGVSSPQAKLQLLDANAVYLQMTDSGNIAGRVGVNGSYMHFGLDGSNGETERMRINSSGQVSIGTTAGLANLTIGGSSDTARVLPATDNVGYIGESVHRWQAIYAVSGSIQTSDEREKTEIKETTLGLDFIKDLKPVSYKWIDGEQQNKGKDKREHQGLIAQQVAETVEKHGIDKNNFGGLDIQKTEKYDDFHGMSYDQFVAPLIKAIQEQQTQIEALQSEINELKNS